MKAKRQYDSTPDAQQLEGARLDVLELVEEHPGDRDRFACCFIHLYDWPDLGPFDVIDDCMAELRWPEVQQYRAGIADVTPEINCRAIANRILAAVTDAWATGAIHARYRPAEIPAPGC